MRRIKLLALALGLCLWAGPALAFTQVNGTGSANSIITPTFIATSSGGAAITAAANVGDLVAITITDFESGTNSNGCANADGSGLNSWQIATGGAAANGAGKHVCYSILAHALSNGTTLTASTTAPDFIMSALNFRPAGTASFDTNATALITSGAGLTVGPTPTLACPSGAANCDVCIGGLAWHATSTLGSDATFTTVGGAGAGQQFLDAFKLVSATTAVSYVTTGGSGNAAGALACFKDTPAAGGPTPRLIMQSVP